MSDAKLAAPAPESLSDDPSDAVGSGYTESKWVAERLLAATAARIPEFDAATIRVGAICGAPNGSWDPAHWIPAMINAGRVLGSLPIVDKVRAFTDYDLD